MLGLRGCGLWAELKALRAQSQELEEVAGRRQLLLQELQAKQQRILHWRRLVVRGGPQGKWQCCMEGQREAGSLRIQNWASGGGEGPRMSLPRGNRTCTKGQAGPEAGR